LKEATKRPKRKSNQKSRKYNGTTPRVAMETAVQKTTDSRRVIMVTA